MAEGSNGRRRFSDKWGKHELDVLAVLSSAFPQWLTSRQIAQRVKAYADSYVTDARQLAAQVIWAAPTPAAHDQAFNIVNGDVFRWNWMWHRLADWFGVKAEDFDGTERPLADQMADDAAIWARIAEREGLAEPDITRLVSPWHTDADLGRPIEVVTDMSKSRKLGFTAYQATDEAFFDLFEQLEADRIIPRR